MPNYIQTLLNGTTMNDTGRIILTLINRMLLFLKGKDYDIDTCSYFQSILHPDDETYYRFNYNSAKELLDTFFVKGGKLWQPFKPKNMLNVMNDCTYYSCSLKDIAPPEGHESHGEVYIATPEQVRDNHIPVEYKILPGGSPDFTVPTVRGPKHLLKPFKTNIAIIGIHCWDYDRNRPIRIESVHDLFRHRSVCPSVFYAGDIPETLQVLHKAGPVDSDTFYDRDYHVRFLKVEYTD